MSFLDLQERARQKRAPFFAKITWLQAELPLRQ